MNKTVVELEKEANGLRMEAALEKQVVDDSYKRVGHAYDLLGKAYHSLGLAFKLLKEELTEAK